MAELKALVANYTEAHGTLDSLPQSLGKELEDFTGKKWGLDFRTLLNELSMLIGFAEGWLACPSGPDNDDPLQLLLLIDRQSQWAERAIAYADNLDALRGRGLDLSAADRDALQRRDATMGVVTVAQPTEQLPFDWPEACRVSAELRSAFQTVALAQMRYEEDFDEATVDALISDLVDVGKRLDTICRPPSRIRALIDTLNRILVVRGLQGAELKTKYFDRNNVQRVYREPRYLCWHEAALKACQ